MHQLLLIAAIIGVWLYARWLFKQPRQKQFQYAAIAVAIVVIGLVVTGRTHWLFAIFAGIIPFFQRILGMLSYLPILGKLFMQFRNMQSGPNSNQTSNVETEYISMTLDHASGQMQGSIKKGSHAGESLESLSLTQLIQLYKDYASIDTDSAQLLEAYLDRTHQDKWRDQADVNNNHTDRPTNQTGMSIDEALNILGLNSDASKDEIVEAHRHLMQKLHPDRGGNDYLAAKINQAKDLLLKQSA